MDPPEAPGALDGVRVVELAQWVFVPVAGALLADWGADVIRIERLEGDPYRGLATQGIGTDSGGVNLSVALANRGKRSIALDLRREQGRALLDELLATADVFLTNFRPGALSRLGLDADTLRQRFPRLVYARGHGFGARGPDADRPGYDSSAFFARGGLAHVLTPPERDYPISQRGAMGDRNGAMALAFGVTAALLRRERTGSGSVVDVSLLATAMWTLSSDVLSALSGTQPRAMPGRTGGPNPLVGTYRTKDGRHIQLVFLEADRYWADFCQLLGRDDLAADPRFADLRTRGANRDACVAELDAEFASRTFEEWKDLLSGIDAPWAPVQAVEELLTDPQVLANDYLGEVHVEDGSTYRLPTVPVQFDERPPPLRRAPEHGEHTEEILLELGRTWEQIGELNEAKVIP
ncbi:MULTISPECIES: CaiB/BaiF CoA-transferase family protein [unclassified Pseudofrankia]|uniref:CaiB/BaiF CoA transferase family protein n=1 Tax=unclassified Pseudofrankia TaxID=2994372 RepID=UPI0008DA91C0|nr:MULTISPECIES: CoA transferase [unclassified Pseudofrankia]MDT3439109.1 CoA transferase [Pseudofrankia sp. BMG5.37]OHV45815.1 formyl-CoA transferase [Pseudofrankia sp. BMG5.36]